MENMPSNNSPPHNENGFLPSPPSMLPQNNPPPQLTTRRPPPDSALVASPDMLTPPPNAFERSENTMGANEDKNLKKNTTDNQVINTTFPPNTPVPTNKPLIDRNEGITSSSQGTIPETPISTENISSGSSKNNFEPQENKFELHRGQNYCSYYPPIVREIDNKDCWSPRSCYDCLNESFLKNECTISTTGLCVATSDPSALKLLDNHGEIRYCEVGDPVCISMKLASNTTIDSNINEIQTGENGCICLSICELPTWLENVGGVKCFNPEKNTERLKPLVHKFPQDPDSGMSKTTVALLAICGCLAIAIIALLVVLRTRNSRSRSSSLQKSKGESHSPFSSPLNSSSRSSSSSASSPSSVSFAIRVASISSIRRSLNLFGWHPLRDSPEKNPIGIGGTTQNIYPIVTAIPLANAVPSAPDYEENIRARPTAPPLSVAIAN